MKILLTGATGFLGSHIAEHLSKQGHQVRCLIRNTASNTFLNTLPNIEYCSGHLLDECALQTAVTGVDAIIHAAGLVKARQPNEFALINAQGTQKLLQAAVNHTQNLKRFVLISSLAAVGPAQEGVPLREDNLTAFNPVTHYGRSKLAAEQHAQQFTDKLPITILRPPLIYGPRDKECLAFFRLIKYKIFPFFGDKQNTASVIYAPDTAQVCSQAIIQTSVPSGTAYFIDDGVIYTNGTMISQLATAMNTTLWLTPTLPMRLLKTAATIAESYGKITHTAVMLTQDKLNELVQPHWVCSSQKAQRELAWCPTIEWATGVKLTYDWYKNAGWL